MNWKLIISAIGFIMIGVSMFFPNQTWIVISGALLFGIGMIRKPKKR